jgi:hypothetical protein
MEKKEQYSMKKQRGLFLGLGLAMLLGLSARESRAETLTLSVFMNGSSTPIFSQTGTAQSVSLTPTQLNNLNSALNGTGYSFTGLSGASNWTSPANASMAFVTDNGNVSYTGAAGSTGGTLTIVVTESGFGAPASGAGNQLLVNQASGFSGASANSSQTYTGNFTDSGSVNMNLATNPLTLTPASATIATGTAPLGAYVTPFTLTNTTTIALGIPGNATTPIPPANDVFSGSTTVSAGAVVPEPASLVMMVTGMPLPLVVMGLLRRRRAAAA